MYDDLNISLLDQLPPWYREILDYQEICAAEQTKFDALALEINAVSQNMFFQTMGETAIAMWENIFGITPNETTETVDFRRARILNRISTKPPFTLAFLYQKLDELIGKGEWSVTVDYPNYTLYVESSAANQQYATELAVTIGRIKPAHIVFVNEPVISSGLLLSEMISAASERWNYKLGSWQLSGNPFLTIYAPEVVKMPTTPSIQTALLSGVAGFVSGDVASARINGTIAISDITKTVTGNTLTVTYDVLRTQATEITLAELLDSNGNVLTSSGVYVPVGVDGVLLEHKIPVQEGI